MEIDQKYEFEKNEIQKFQEFTIKLLELCEDDMQLSPSLAMRFLINILNNMFVASKLNPNQVSDLLEAVKLNYRKHFEDCLRNN